MKITTVDKAAFRRMPWANGGGETTELHSHVDEGSGRMLWRISMADVLAAGPFSHFDNYDRVLVLLEGHGLRLSYEGGGNSQLRRRYDFAKFPGDIDTFATVSDGPIRDFNIIADRSSFKPDVSIVQSGDSFRVLPSTRIAAVYAAEDDVVVDAPDKSSNKLPLGDLLIIENPMEGNWSIHGSTSIVVHLLPLMA
jgi:environmental stress-induced protein Ves